MKYIIVTKNMILGNLACMAVQQSPYHRPDNLEVVLDKMNESIKDDFKEYIMLFKDSAAIEDYLEKHLGAIPEYVAWNDRKNGNNAPYKFTSRYDTDDNPDDDFIDLDALRRNVARLIENEASEL